MLADLLYVQKQSESNSSHMEALKNQYRCIYKVPVVKEKIASNNKNKCFRFKSLSYGCQVCLKKVLIFSMHWFSRLFVRVMPKVSKTKTQME